MNVGSARISFSLYLIEHLESRIYFRENSRIALTACGFRKLIKLKIRFACLGLEFKNVNTVD